MRLTSVPSDRQRGFALVSVLWAVMALSLIAAAVASSGFLARKVQKTLEAEAVADALLEAGIARACLALLDTRRENLWPVDGTPRPLRLLDREMTIGIQDETGLIDLNTAGFDLFRALFRSAGADGREADLLSNRILAWRSPAGLEWLGADEGNLAKAGFRPRRGPFQSVDELMFVEGITDDLFMRLSGALTVYSQKADVDPSIAPRDVLILLPGMTEDRLDALLASRQQLAPSRSSNQSLAGRAFSVRVTLDHDGRTFARYAVFRLTPRGSTPCLRLH